MSNRLPSCLFWVLTCVLVMLLTQSAFVHSPTIDECGHLAAGLSHHELAAFDLYAVNPPLVRLWATLPVSLMNPRTDWRGYTHRSDSRPEFRFGRKIIALNGNQTGLLIGIARLACIPCFLLGAVICQHYPIGLSSKTGVVAGGLWVLSPLVLGFSSLIVPDLTSAAIGLLASVAIKKWSEGYTLRDAIGVAICCSVALLTKFTWIVILPLQFAGAVIFSRVRPSLTTLTTHSLLLSTVFIILANLIYAGTDSLQRLDEIRLVSNTLSEPAGPKSTARLSKFSSSPVGAIRIPVSAKILQGLDIQKRDFERGYRSYLMGEWKHGGWWYYYLVGFLVKEPIGFQILLYVSILHGLWNWKRWTRESIREWAFIVLPPVLIFALVSSQTGFNHHMRYVLPAYPFLFIIAARTFTLGRLFRWLTYICLTWQATAVLWFAPHWMSYFNEAAGGPENGHEWLVDSNIDWGQDILMLKWWQDRNPDVDLQAALFAGFDPTHIGLKFRLPTPFVKDDPTVVSDDGLRGPQPGWYAISICQLKGHYFNVPKGDGTWTWSKEHFTYFMDHFEPVDKIGYSIYIYHITQQQADDVRTKLQAEEETISTTTNTMNTE